MRLESAATRSRWPRTTDGMGEATAVTSRMVSTVTSWTPIACNAVIAPRAVLPKPMTAAVEDFVHAGYDLTAEAILLCESDGTPEEVSEEVDRMLDVLTGCGATRLEVSRDEAQRQRFWSGRKNAFPASLSPEKLRIGSRRNSVAAYQSMIDPM